MSSPFSELVEFVPIKAQNGAHWLDEDMFAEKQMNLQTNFQQT
jgi:hypothetical protein